MQILAQVCTLIPTITTLTYILPLCVLAAYPSSCCTSLRSVVIVPTSIKNVPILPLFYFLKYSLHYFLFFVKFTTVPHPMQHNVPTCYSRNLFDFVQLYCPSFFFFSMHKCTAPLLPECYGLVYKLKCIAFRSL